MCLGYWNCFKQSFMNKMCILHTVFQINIYRYLYSGIRTIRSKITNTQWFNWYLSISVCNSIYFKFHTILLSFYFNATEHTIAASILWFSIEFILFISFSVFLLQDFLKVQLSLFLNKWMLWYCIFLY